MFGEALQIHCWIFKNGLYLDPVVKASLINTYSKIGDINAFELVFSECRDVKQVGVWANMISAFAQNELYGNAIALFRRMLNQGIKPDKFIASSILSIIDSLTLVSWTSIIASYAHHGNGFEALRLFELMKKSGIEPDNVTFVGVLSACSHAGMVEEGYFHLNSMLQDYGIKPGYKHYACMVDRAGRLQEALRFIVNMPIEPDRLVWGTLLAACKVHDNIEVGKMMELQPLDAGVYISISNICGSFCILINFKIVREWGKRKEIVRRLMALEEGDMLRKTAAEVAAAVRRAAFLYLSWNVLLLDNND